MFHTPAHKIRATYEESCYAVFVKADPHSSADTGYGIVVAREIGDQAVVLDDVPRDVLVRPHQWHDIADARGACVLPRPIGSSQYAELLARLSATKLRVGVAMRLFA